MTDPALNRSALVAGVFYIAAGAVFLLERLGVWEVSLRVLGPVVLITLGLAIILGGRVHRPPSSTVPCPPPLGSPRGAPGARLPGDLLRKERPWA